MSDINKIIQEFERSRIQLGAIEQQVNSLNIQSQVLGEAIKELGESKEEKVYKAVGNILILSNAKKVLADVEKQKETIDLRAKTLKKQESAAIDKLNKLKAEIEAAQKGANKDEKKEAE